MKIDQSLLELKSKIKGELHSDALQLGIYATDASNYQIIPLAVALPKVEADVLLLLEWAYNHKIPVIARGGGTSPVSYTHLTLPTSDLV